MTAAHASSLAPVAPATPAEIPLALPGDPAPAFACLNVPRTALVRRLREARDARLAVVVAPLGFGKTRLLNEWAERDERTFLWLSPEEGWSALDQMVRTLHAPFVAVIDAAETVEPGLLARMTQRALTTLPPGGMIALASRTEPPLPLGRLRAQRMLIEVRTSDLSMDPVQTAELLRLEGLDPTAEEADTLAAATGGWPAVLVLAALATRVTAQRPLRFDPAHHLIRDYLCDEVLAALPEDLERLAVRTSMLDGLSGVACDAVLDETGSARRLARLATLTGLLIPTDAAHHTFRWHVVMRGALRSELRRTEPEIEPELHARASRWHRRWGETEQAAAHAAAAGDVPLLEHLLCRYGLDPLTHGRDGAVRGWLDMLGDGVVADNPMLALCASLAALSSGDAPSARRWAHAGLIAGSDGPAAAVAARLRLTQAIAGTARVDALGDAAAAVIASSEAGTSWDPYCRMVQGVSLHLSGDPASAAGLLDEAITSIGDLAPVVTVLGLGQRAMIAIERGEWEVAAEVTDRALEGVARCDLGDSPPLALAFAAAAASRAHEGRADEAKADLRHGVDLLARLEDFAPWYGAECRILLGHASLWVADVTRARMLLAEASRLVRRVPDAVVFQRWFDAAWEQMDTLAETSLSGPSSLTIAELRVLRFLPSHRSFREIGGQLGVSGNTIKTQAHAIYRKLGVASRSEAVAHAGDAGLLGR